MRLSCIFIFFLFAFSVMGQDNTFIRTFNLPGMHGGLSLEVLQGGGFVGTGQHSDNGNCRVYVYRIDECGNIIWFNLYNSGGGVALDEISTGGLIIAQESMGTGLLKLDGNGDVVWDRNYPEMGHYMTSVKATSDGGYLAGGDNGSIMKADVNGNVLWAASTIGGYINAVDEFSNGDYLFFGNTANSLGNTDFYLGRVSSTGTLIWQNTYGTGGWFNSFSAFSGEAKIDFRDNTIIVTSNTYNNDEDILIAKLDFFGNIISAASIGLAGQIVFDQSRSIDLALDNGYIIGGCANSFNTTDLSLLTQVPDETPQALTGMDIFLVKTDSLGVLEWTSVIGADGTDKAIGVRTNKDNGYTISAYTDASFFGAGGGNSFDPLFIKTDSLGRVGCQQYSPTATQTQITLSATSNPNFSTLAVTSIVNTILKDTLNPPDRFMCLDCSTTPFFTISDTTLCVGDTTWFVNNSFGLICNQNWYVDGTVISGPADSVPFAFSSPGVHNIKLETTCGATYVEYNLDFYVNNIRLYVTDISEYNGYEISCNGYDGFIKTYATSPFPPVNYSWNTPNPTSPNQYNLNEGMYTLQLTDDYGCIFDTTFILQSPPLLMLISNLFNDTCDRQTGMAEVIVSGGVLPYNYLWSNNSTTSTINNLSAGHYSVTITDSNNCIISEQFDIITIHDPVAEFNVVPNVNMHHLYKQMDDPILFIDKSVDEFTMITKWFWEFEDGFSSYDQNTAHSFAEIGDFNVTLAIENLYGCVDTITKRVIVEEFLLYIPNSFTPQRDRINDIFLPKGIGIQDYELKIYNRWGEHFFTSNDLNIGWDGTSDSEKRIAQTGVYIYLINVIDVFGDTHEYTGEVILIR